MAYTQRRATFEKDHDINGKLVGWSAERNGIKVRSRTKRGALNTLLLFEGVRKAREMAHDAQHEAKLEQEQCK